jgi:branched-chain amino acid transport system permease protein
VVAVVATLAPALFIHAGILNDYYAQVLTMGGITAIIAISVNVVAGITGQLTLGQAGFMAIGAYSCIVLTQDVGLPLAVAAMGGAVSAAICGALIGFPTLKLTGDYLAIVTLAFGEIIRIFLTNMQNITGGPAGMRFPTFMQDISTGPALSFIIITGTLALIVALLQNFLRSSYGRAIAAVREDEIAANSSGIPVFRYKMLGFVIGAFIAGAGGALYAMFVGFVKPDMAGFIQSTNYMIYVVLGGMGSMTGSIVASFVLYGLQEFLRFLQDYRLIIYPFILILVMIFRPQGLLGMREVSFVGLCRRAWRLARRAAK